MIKARPRILTPLQLSSLSSKFLFPKLGSKAENWVSKEKLVPRGVSQKTELAK